MTKQLIYILDMGIWVYGLPDLLTQFPVETLPNPPPSASDRVKSQYTHIRGVFSPDLVEPCTLVL